MSALQVQVGGSHYKDCKIQPIEFIHANNLNFSEGSIVKYITRYKNKNGKQDLLKIKHYVDLIIEQEYPNSDIKSGNKAKTNNKGTIMSNAKPIKKVAPKKSAKKKATKKKSAKKA